MMINCLKYNNVWRSLISLRTGLNTGTLMAPCLESVRSRTDFPTGHECTIHSTLIRGFCFARLFDRIKLLNALTFQHFCTYLFVCITKQLEISMNNCQGGYFTQLLRLGEQFFWNSYVIWFLKEIHRHFFAIMFISEGLINADIQNITMFWLKMTLIYHKIMLSELDWTLI